MLFLQPKALKDYELIDSGNRQKLERFGRFVFCRPEPKALWERTLPFATWQKADAMYMRNNSGGGAWKYNRQLPDSWTMNWKSLEFKIKPTGFKHMGIFPEQEPLWEYVQEQILNAKSTDPNAEQPHILNLFGYTGGTTIAASAAGAKVTHVDASKEVVTWARENAAVSGLADRPIRWLVEDVLTYVRREIKRGTKYDGIIIDAPKFGRGAKGEVWKIEDDLSKLFDLCMPLLSKQPLFVILLSYTADYSSLVMQNILSQRMKQYSGVIDYGELTLPHTSNKMLLSTTVFARWRR